MVLESVHVGVILAALTFPLAMVAALLPHRHWRKLPGSFPMETAAVAGGVATLFAGAAVGIPGFLEHATANTSLAIDSQLTEAARNAQAGYSQGLSQGFAGLSIFTFLLLTPKGWLTTYLIGTGGVRMGAAWFDDPVGDPVLTGLDEILWRRRSRRKAVQEARTREELEGPEIPDRVVSSAKAGIPGCDLVIVSSRRKPGWARDVVVYTPEACYRIGDPVERTVAGRLRMLYPLTEHVDLEAVRKSVHYDMPDAHSRD
jgi:hypothetical protein